MRRGPTDRARSAPGPEPAPRAPTRSEEAPVRPQSWGSRAPCRGTARGSSASAATSAVHRFHKTDSSAAATASSCSRSSAPGREESRPSSSNPTPSSPASRRSCPVSAAPHHHLRAVVVPTPAVDSPVPVAPKRPKRMTWADILMRVWAIDALKCPHCGGRMRDVAAIRPRREHRYPRGRPLGQVVHKGQRTSRGGTSARERRGLTVPRTSTPRTKAVETATRARRSSNQAMLGRGSAPAPAAPSNAGSRG